MGSTSKVFIEKAYIYVNLYTYVIIYIYLLETPISVVVLSLNIGQNQHSLLHQRLENYGPWTESAMLSVFVNKVSVKHSHSHLFMYYKWLSLYSGRVLW